MLYKNGKLKKLFAIMLAVFCFTALSSIAVFAIDIDGGTWQKIDSSAGKNSFSVEDSDFVVIKQATGAVIWLKHDMSDADQLALIAKIYAKDPSILYSCADGDGIAFTTQTYFILKDVLDFTGNGGKYDAVITVGTVSGVLTMTINGSYSHYCCGSFVKETTAVVITTTTAEQTTAATSAEQTTAATSAEQTTVIVTSTPPLTNETTVAETSTPPETSDETMVITTPPPPYTNETLATAITDPNPPYTGADFGAGSFRAIITAAALFGSLSGIAVLLYAMRRSKPR